MRTTRNGLGLAALGLLLATLALPAEAQNASSRWLAFVGCWEPLGVEEDAGLLCFEPIPGGVEMSNVLQGEVTATETLVADGVPRPVAAEGCTGSESVEFSDDGRRVYTSSSFDCEGGEARAGTGVMSFISPTQWIDVRSLTVEGEPVAWVQRYSVATAESLGDHGVDDPAAADRSGVRARRMAAARDIEIADVEEVLSRVEPQAVKIWIATHDTDLDVEASDLVRLADAGVPDDVIDVMVAVSFPERFALTPEGVPQGVRERVASNAYRTGARIGYRSYLWDPFYYGPRRYRYGYGYGYSPFGYYGSGGYYGYVPGSIIVVPRDDGVQPAGGRIERGRGYRGPSTGSAGPPASRGGSTAAPSPSRDGGSSSGSSGSSGGGRRAVRR